MMLKIALPFSAIFFLLSMTFCLGFSVGQKVMLHDVERDLCAGRPDVNWSFCK